MLKKLITDDKLGGVNCLIWRDGDILYRESHGVKDLDTMEPITTDTIFRISSMTKPVTSVLAMMLYEEGKLSLADPITNWFPQFSDMQVLTGQGVYEKANRVITVFDLLTHTAGFTYSEFQSGKLREDYVRVLGGDIDTDLTNQQWIDGLASLPLVSQPGDVFHYGRSTDLLGLLIAKIEALPLGRVMKNRIFDPLGMRDTSFYVPVNERNRCAGNIGYDEMGKLTMLKMVPLNMAMPERPEDLEFESGGQGLWSTMGDYLKFARIFIEGGSSDIPVLKRETIHLMCSNQLTPLQRQRSTLMGSAMFRENHGFGLGLAVVTQENPFLSIPCAGSPGTVGWPGAYGGWWSADPAKKVISIFMTHSMTTPGQLAQGIGFGLYEAIDLFATFSHQLTRA